MQCETASRVCHLCLPQLRWQSLVHCQVASSTRPGTRSPRTSDLIEDAASAGVEAFPSEPTTAYIFRLQNVYMDEEAVDDALVDMLFDPSNDVGALDAFVSIITGLALPLLSHWQFSACLL